MQIIEETHRPLYYDLDECLKCCKNIPETEYKESTYFHMYWNVGLPFERKQLLPIKSYLTTQNLYNTKLIIWSNVDLSDNELIKKYSENIEFRIYDPIKESIGTELENRKDLLTVNDSRNWAGGDLFRILVLHNYGGLYVDFDVVFLRDFAPLLSQEFMYKWGLEKDMINGAIMRGFKHSQLMKDLIHEIAIGGSFPNSTIWSTNLYQKVRNYNKNWTIFPSGFFNSEWQDMKFNTPGNGEVFLPFTKNDFDMYDGAFSWHWHNKWTSDIEEGSKWQVLESSIDKKL